MLFYYCLRVFLSVVRYTAPFAESTIQAYRRLRSARLTHPFSQVTTSFSTALNSWIGRRRVGFEVFTRFSLPYQESCYFIETRGRESLFSLYRFLRVQ